MYLRAFALFRAENVILAFGLVVATLCAEPTEAGVCLNRLTDVSRIYGTGGENLVANQRAGLSEIPHVPTFLAIDPGGTINYQRQIPRRSCNGCAILFSAVLNGYDLGNSHVPEIASEAGLACLLTRNVSLTLTDGIQSHTFEVWDYDPKNDELLAVDFAPRISMLQDGRNFAGISGRPATLANGLEVISLRLADIYPFLTSVHFMVDAEQLPQLSRALEATWSAKDIATQLVLASAISGNLDALKQSMDRHIAENGDFAVGRLGRWFCIFWIFWTEWPKLRP